MAHNFSTGGAQSSARRLLLGLAAIVLLFILAFVLLPVMA